MSKYKAFSLIEIMIVIGVVSLVLAISAPIFTKRIKNTNASGCVGGAKVVKKVFVNDGNFVVPDNVDGDVTFTLIGAGGGGGGAYDFSWFSGTGVTWSYSRTIVISDAQCVVNLPDNDDFDNPKPMFYSNVLLNATKAGESSNSNAPGRSGAYIYNYNVPARPNCSYSYSVSNEKLVETCGAETSEIGLNFLQGNSGESGTNGVSDYLSGGYPKPMIFSSNRHAFGMGQGCVWNGANCSPGIASTPGGCQMTYRRAFAGPGGGGGAYAKFSVNLNKNAVCSVAVGKGGRGSATSWVSVSGAPVSALPALANYNNNIDGENGGNTTLTCGQSVYTAGGGSGILVNSTVPGNGGTVQGTFPSDAILGAGRAGGSPMENSTISGGKGGDGYIYSDNNSEDSVPYIEGAKGGCEGSLSSAACEDPGGKNGVSPSSDLKQAGSGGGGGSCNDDRCGIGGTGADGIIIVEYKTRCY